MLLLSGWLPVGRVDVIALCEFYGGGVHFCVVVCKRKAAYGVLISDWSSDLCSSDLPAVAPVCGGRRGSATVAQRHRREFCRLARRSARRRQDRKSAAQGTSVSVSVDLGGRRIIKKQKP